MGLDIAGPYDIALQNQKFVVALIDYYLGYPERLLTSNTSATHLRSDWYGYYFKSNQKFVRLLAVLSRTVALGEVLEINCTLWYIP